MLSFAEEIYLLALDDVKGRITGLKETTLEYALIGAVLCELSFMNKLDVDSKGVCLIDLKPVNRPAIDAVIGVLKNISDTRTLATCMKEVYSKTNNKIQKLVLDQLIDKKILKCEAEKIFWIFHSVYYPLIDEKKVKAVEHRLRELLLNDDIIPEPRDVVLVCLAESCNLFKDILSKREKQRVIKRIENLGKLDLVGQRVMRIVSEFNGFFKQYMNSANSFGESFLKAYERR